MLNKLFNKTELAASWQTTDIAGLDLEKLPKHIAIIMDGNGRWAKQRGQARTFGHKAGADALETIIRFADRLHIECLTVYAFSTENWKRPISEVSYIMQLIALYLKKKIDEFHSLNGRIRFCGRREGVPLDYAVEKTKNNTGIIINLALNYGSQDELVHAARALAEQVQVGTLQPSEITPGKITENLYTAGLPEVDLLIRPGGDYRVSNFLLWQIAYAEIWYTPVLWPDFTPAVLVQAIKEFQGRERRFGGLVES